MEKDSIIEIFSLIQLETSIQNRIGELEDLLKTDKFRATLWSNNGAVSGCESLIDFDEVKKRINNELILLNNRLIRVNLEKNAFRNQRITAVRPQHPPISLIFGSQSSGVHPVAQEFYTRRKKNDNSTGSTN